MKRTAYLAGLACALALASPAAAEPCCGDCDGNGTVVVSELVTEVGSALNGCPTDGPCCGDCDGSGSVAVNELVTSVGNALDGCPGAPTRTVTPTGTVTPTPINTPTGVPTATFPQATPTVTETPSKTVVPSKTSVPSKTPIPTKTAPPTRTATTAPSATATPPTCPIALNTDSQTICTFLGRFNANCGGKVEARLIVNHGQILVGVKITGLQLSQFYQGTYAPVDWAFIEGDVAANATLATLLGWFTRDDGSDLILMDGTLELQNGQRLVITPDSWNPSTQTGDPSFDLNGCRFAEYQGNLTAVQP